MYYLKKSASIKFLKKLDYIYFFFKEKEIAQETIEQFYKNDNICIVLAAKRFESSITLNLNLCAENPARAGR